MKKESTYDLEAEAARAFHETAMSSNPHGVIASALRVARAEARREALEELVRQCETSGTAFVTATDIRALMKRDAA